MEKILLVDDEPASLTGLRTCVDWEKLGLEICAEARNGKQAMALISEHDPAVVIADVRMPFVGGLELTRHIQESGLATKVILISAYPDLDSVKSGFHHAAVDFVLKPINVAELEGAVRAAMMKRTVENRIKTSLREKFLIELVSGVHARNQDIQSQIAWLDIDIPRDSHYVVCVAKPTTNRDNTPEREVSLALAGEKFQSLLETHPRGFAFRSLFPEVVCLVPLSADGSQSVERLDEFLAAAATALRASNGGTFRIGVGIEVVGITNVHRSYESALIALEQRFFRPDDAVYYADLTQTNDAGETDLPPSELESLCHAIIAGNGDKIGITVNTIVDAAASGGMHDLEKIHGIGYRIMVAAANTLVRMGDSGSRVAEKTYEAWRLVESQQTLDDFKTVLTDFLLSVCNTVSDNHRTHAQALVEAVKAFVAAKYGEPIGISTIAEQLQYTESHICNVFKKETGETINEYLTRYRIDRASELLTEHALRLYEICDRVGYKDYKHFVALFKRQNGMTPSEYRDRLIYESDQ